MHMDVLSLASHTKLEQTSQPLNREKVICYQLEFRKLLADALVIIKMKVEEVQTTLLFYSHALLRIHVIGGQRSVRIAPPSLPLYHSGPATRDFQSSISVEALLCRCHLDVQGLLLNYMLHFNMHLSDLKPKVSAV